MINWIKNKFRLRVLLARYRIDMKNAEIAYRKSLAKEMQRGGWWLERNEYSDWRWQRTDEMRRYAAIFGDPDVAAKLERTYIAAMRKIAADPRYKEILI